MGVYYPFTLNSICYADESFIKWGIGMKRWIMVGLLATAISLTATVVSASHSLDNVSVQPPPPEGTCPNAFEHV